MLARLDSKADKCLCPSPCRKVQLVMVSARVGENQRVVLRRVRRRFTKQAAKRERAIAHLAGVTS